MDEQMQRQLVRQLKILNTWISVLGILLLVSIAICAYLLFRVVTFVQDTSEKVTSLQQKTENSLNVRKQLCESDSLSSLLDRGSDVCKTQ